MRRAKSQLAALQRPGRGLDKNLENNPMQSKAAPLHPDVDTAP